MTIRLYRFWNLEFCNSAIKTANSATSVRNWIIYLTRIDCWNKTLFWRIPFNDSISCSCSNIKNIAYFQRISWWHFVRPTGSFPNGNNWWSSYRSFQSCNNFTLLFLGPNVKTFLVPKNKALNKIRHLDTLIGSTVDPGYTRPLSVNGEYRWPWCTPCISKINLTQ